MQSLTLKLALVSLLGTSACGVPQPPEEELSAETDTAEQPLHGEEVSLPLCDLSNMPSGWSCWLDEHQQAPCPANQTPAWFWLRPEAGTPYVHADASLGSRDVATWDLSWGEDAFYARGESVFCESTTETYQASTWSQHSAGPGLPLLQSRLTSFIQHLRPALTRGTVFVSFDEAFCASAGGCTEATSLILVLNKRDTFPTWTEVTRREFPLIRGAPEGAFEVKARIDPINEVSFEVYVRNASNSISEVVFHDMRLFTEKCIPDMSTPGQCLP
ncbi:hypothetical protein [Myxococcus stipitatus]|uniref:hypothetical protein n=1 Tax=Myxococcus stipitatus TaxID=83455 RepID=UPI0030D49CFD